MHEGSCQCRAVRYRLSGEPLSCYACHCTECQTSTGSAFTLSMIVNRADVALIAGSLSEHRFLHNGIDVKRHHCGHCGTALWFSSETVPDIYALKPGTFDDTSWFRPVAHLWVRSAQPWVVFADDAVVYETQPDMAELFELWAQRSKS